MEAGTPEYENDSLRPLTDKGKKKMQKIARGLKELDAEIDLIISSPYARAVGTTKILRKAFDLNEEDIVETEHLSPVGYSDQLIDLINEKYADIENIALVGHEPSLSNLVSILVTGDPNLALTLKKGGICRLAVDTLQYGRCATLEWLLSPSQLAEFSE
ncbi:MAG TPA: phosphohistidine phosphatase SixA [Anaerolineales bacterium]|nr:phosphohistidine phosphatase SixA [Anaerolineales bacterium]